METEVVVTEGTINTFVNEAVVFTNDTTTNEAAVTVGEADVNEAVPTETEATVNLESPMETETNVNPTVATEAVDDDTDLATVHQAIQKKIEEAVMAIVRTTEVEETSVTQPQRTFKNNTFKELVKKRSWVDKKIKRSKDQKEA